jgi:predicted phage terminase large subunit-like protein
VVLYHAEGKSYVAEVYRDRVKIEDFRAKVLQLQRKHGGKVFGFVAHTEKGSIEMLNPPDREGRIPAEAVPAVTDKFVRAQPVAAAWRAGKVMVPRTAPWLGAFLGEVLSFTGVKDAHDDCVDSLAGAFHPYSGPPRSRAQYTDSSFGFG